MNLFLRAVLGLNKTEFDAGMDAAKSKVSSFGKDLAAAFSVAATAAAIKATIQYADETSELAERLGITATQAQEFALAAKLGGADAETFATAFEKLNRAIVEAVAKADAGIFKAFGLSLEQISNNTTAQTLDAIGVSLRQTGIDGEKAASMFEIWDRKSGRLVNILGDLQQAREGAFTMSDAEIQSVKKMDDWWEKLTQRAKAAAGMLLNNPTRTINAALGFERATLDAFPEDAPGKGVDPFAKIAAEKKAKEDAAKDAKKAVIKNAELQDFIDEKARANVLATMTEHEKLNELIEDRLDITRQIDELDVEAVDAKTKFLELSKKGVIIEGEIVAAQNAIDRTVATVATPHKFDMEKTKLGSIGGGLGNSGVDTARGLAAVVEQVKRTNEILKGGQMVVGHWR